MIMALARADMMEQVTGIEPALSAWEIERLHPVWELTCRFRPPPVPVADPSSPWLMAR